MVIRDKILKKNGWVVECESPLEIRHTDGSFASGIAAQYAIDGIMKDDISLDSPLEILQEIKIHLEYAYYNEKNVTQILYDSESEKNKVSFGILSDNRLKYLISVKDIEKVNEMITHSK